MSQANKLDLNFKMEEIIKASLETLGRDNMSICIVREMVQRTLIFRRQRIYKEYKAEYESYRKLYGHHQAGDKVPAKVNNKITKINRMSNRLDKLDVDIGKSYIPYNDYWPVIEEKLKKVLLT